MATAAEAIKIEWREEATEIQHEFSLNYEYAQWNSMDKGKPTILRKKVGYAIYGPPPKEPVNSEDTGYEGRQLKIIENICKQLNKINENNFQKEFYFTCILVTCKTPNDKFTLPVFKTRKTLDSGVNIVDTYCRVYSSWSEYLENNTLPECMYCYPRDGCYTEDTNGNILLDFGTSPAGKPLEKIASVMDTTSTVVTFGTTIAFGIAALASITISGPIITGMTVASVASGVYTVGRSTAHLVDRSKHEQSIGLHNKESIGCWVSIVGGALGAGQGLLNKFMTPAMRASARSGEVMGKFGKLAFAVNVGCLTVNGLRIVCKVAAFIKGEDEELTQLEIFQFTSACLFYLNEVMSVESAKNLIERARSYFMAHRSEVNINTEINVIVSGLQQLRGKAYLRTTMRSSLRSQGNSFSRRLFQLIRQNEILQY